MKGVRFIGMALLVVWLTGCSTVETPPADDAYYWDEPWSMSSGRSSSASITTPSTSSSVEVSETSSKPVIEYTNVSDTVVTVRIKR